MKIKMTWIAQIAVMALSLALVAYIANGVMRSPRNRLPDPATAQCWLAVSNLEAVVTTLDGRCQELQNRVQALEATVAKEHDLAKFRQEMQAEADAERDKSARLLGEWVDALSTLTKHVAEIVNPNIKPLPSPRRQP